MHIAVRLLWLIHDKAHPSNRIPYQASYKYRQRGLPEKEVLPHLQGPRGI